MQSTKRLPLATRPAFRANDLQAACEHLGGPLWPHVGRLLERRAPIDFVHHSAEVANIGIHAIRYGAPVELDVAPANDAYLLLVLFHGSVEIMQPGRTLTADTVRIGIVNPDRPVRLRLSRGQRNLTVRVPRRFLNEYAERLCSTRLRTPVEFTDVALAPGLRRFVQATCEELVRQQSAITTYAVARPLAETLAGLMLTEVPHSHMHVMRQLNGRVLTASLQRAIEFIDTRLTHEFTLTDIARAAAASPRTLQTAFQHELATTPTLYVRERRLQRARAALSSQAAATRSIADIACGSGFSHLGKFGRYYRERYGETPSATRERTRRGYLGACRT